MGFIYLFINQAVLAFAVLLELVSRIVKFHWHLKLQPIYNNNLIPEKKNYILINFIIKLLIS